MKIAVVTGAFALTGVVITGLFTLAAKDGGEQKAGPAVTTPSTTGTSTSPITTPAVPPAYSGPPFQLTAERTGDPLHVSVNATRHRPAQGGHSYWLVMRVHNVNGHSEYYPRKDLTSGDASVTFTLDIPPDATVSPRSVQVYEVGDSDAAWMAEGLDDPNGISEKHLVHPPCGGSCGVSAVAPLPFEQ